MALAGEVWGIRQGGRPSSSHGGQPAPTATTTPRDLAVRAIIGTVVGLDQTHCAERMRYAAQSPSGAGGTTSTTSLPATSTGAEYLRWRQSLLQQAKLAHMGPGDRRDQYLQWRRMILEQRFPKQQNSPMADATISNGSRVAAPVMLKSLQASDSLQIRRGRRSAGSQILRSSDVERGRVRAYAGHSRSHSTSTAADYRPGFLQPIVPGATASVPAVSKQDSIVTQGYNAAQPTSNSSVRIPEQTVDKGVSVAYEFSGMHYIFDHHNKAITALRFAHEDKDLLAIASMDGTISICSTFDSPSVLGILKGHTRGVTDIDWSLSNDYLVSSSLDGSVRVWDLKTRTAIRGVKNASPCYACRFMPLNTNIFLYGTSRGNIHVINLSTGKPVEQLTLGDPILCMEFEPTGKVLFAGDDKGFVHVLEYNFMTGKFQSRGKSKIALGGQGVTSLEYKSWFNNQRGVRTPQLIATCLDSTVKLCGVEEGASTSLKVQREFRIVNKSSRVRCRFCPLLSTETGACLVSGSEDMSIYIYNVKKRGPKSLVNKLQGHSAAVIDVSWNYEESLLASGDAAGIVIIWKRVQMDSKTLTRDESRHEGL